MLGGLCGYVGRGVWVLGHVGCLQAGGSKLVSNTYCIFSTHQTNWKALIFFQQFYISTWKGFRILKYLKDICFLHFYPLNLYPPRLCRLIKHSLENWVQWWKKKKRCLLIKVKHEKSTSLTFVKSNARSESAKYYLSCIIFSQTKSLKRTKVRWLQTQTIERHITCILLDIESRSLRISCRFFVPRMFLNVVWASSLIGSEFKKSGHVIGRKWGKTAALLLLLASWYSESQKPRQQCWPESFCKSGKFLRQVHYWLKNFRIIWKIYRWHERHRRGLHLKATLILRQKDKNRKTERW